ncbi:DUF5808 domain-containing protein [Sporosarcina sp. FSL K6-1540]|uniref:DUF1648 domain-containing protein n=1 Tax=unclassified Sporosarcina TaxID=2647733 RepID=UPI00164E425A|nr:DUF5808 domain-containing protein [Sporosarcina sp. resist]QNK89769.1 DUF1648 domain-containing protein [Sporosarcina sp. resist]
MELTLFLVIIGFLFVLLSATPFLLRRTIAFGVTIPEGHTDDPTIASFKKIYAATIFITGLISLIAYFTLANTSSLTEDKIILTGLAIQFGIIFLSMGLYFYFHAKTTRLKQLNEWGLHLKQVRIADLAIRTKDEMLPSFLYALPMIITIGLIAYTATQYSSMPSMIPTHWGPSGQADAFSPKTPFSVIALLLILLVMQGMMLGINAFTKNSGIKLNAAKRKTSQIQQLSFRKYTSWLLFMISVLMTVLLGFLQLTTIHEGLGSAVLMLALPLGFSLIVLITTAIYAFKVGQSGSRINVDIEDDSIAGITDVDDDKYWKAGIFYVNKDDSSIFVEKRFGVGWTINFANPIGYIILFGPLLLILAITFFL